MASTALLRAFEDQPTGQVAPTFHCFRLILPTLNYFETVTNL